MKKFSVIVGISFFAGALFFALSFGYIKPSSDRVVTHEPVFAKSNESISQELNMKEKFTGVSLAPVVKMVKPAVVKIVTMALDTSSRSSMFNDELFRRFFGRQKRQSRRIPKSGSGFLISKDGYIVTNNHVVKDAQEVTVTLSDKTQYKAKIIGTDPPTDLALIKISGKSFPYITFGDSEKIEVGDFVLAIGNPLSQNLTVTSGIISAKNRFLEGLRDINYQNFLQTDAAINQGNSGGPLVNVQGQAIGINSVILSGTGGNIGLGFSIPSNMAKKVIKSLKEKGTVIRGYLGVNLSYYTPDEAKEQLGIKLCGAIIQSVEADTPAQKAGLKKFDFITEINGKAATQNTLPTIIADTAPGSTIKLTVYRGKGFKNEKLNLSVKVGKIPGIEKEVKNHSKASRLGLQLKNNTRSLANQYNLPTSKGIVIFDVESNSNAEENGLRRGDIILSIARTDVKNIKHFFELISSRKGGSKVLMEINRNGQPYIFGYKLPE